MWFAIACRAWAGGAGNAAQSQRRQSVTCDARCASLRAHRNRTIAALSEAQRASEHKQTRSEQARTLPTTDDDCGERAATAAEDGECATAGA